MGSATGPSPHEGLGRTARRRPEARPPGDRGRDRGGRHRPGPGAARPSSPRRRRPRQRPQPSPCAVRTRARRRASGSSAPAPSGRPWDSHSTAPAGRSTRWPAATSGDVNAPRALAGATRAFAEAQALVEEVELIIVAIPDDALRRSRPELRMYSGQAMVHTSGALDADVLAPAMAAGTQIGAFHPLVAFAETERAVADLHGATIAIEARRPARRPPREDGRGRRRSPGPAGARLQGGLPRGGSTGRRRRRGAARCDRRARPRRRTGRGRLPGHLRAADRWDAGAMHGRWASMPR